MGHARPTAAIVTQTRDAATDAGLREIHNRHFHIPTAVDGLLTPKKTPLRTTEGAHRRENSLITGRGGGTASGEAASRSRQEPTINLQDAFHSAEAHASLARDDSPIIGSGARFLTVLTVHRTSPAATETARTAERGQSVSARGTTDTTTARAADTAATAAARTDATATSTASCTTTATTATATAATAATAGCFRRPA
ncbi:hypothetical protein [Pandoraea pnomenusa]|uniref:hypothetical protein n=1 Tax=Pandoraea pnomenusa TaxID=93220 RepID=UPI00242A461D|nr:hypothetical protein [Pandoraea pnomenusa]